ncbi:MAG TPA: TIGR03089 family protein [Egibacteraceae bacterium]|nr:TIGR03089 family protein [Egibacteraceae bacterium]
MGSLDELAGAARRLPAGDPPAARNLSALLAERVAARGHHPFLTFYDDASGERTELSYATFDNWVAKTANLLVEELGVGRGDRVATVLGDHWTALVVAFACWKVGSCVVPLTAGDPGPEPALGPGPSAAAAFVRENLLGGDGFGGGAPCRLVAVGTGMGARLTAPAALPPDVLPYGEEVPAFADDYDDPEVRLDDDALLVPGGGVSPAKVRLTQGNLLAAAEAVCAWGVGPGDRVLCAQPVQLVDSLALGHLGPLVAGGSVVLNRAPDPAGLWRRAAGERVTLLLASPTVVDRLPEGDPPEGLRGVLVASGAASDVLTDAGQRLPVAVGHGVVEACCASTLSPLPADGETTAWMRSAAGRPVGAVTARAAVAALDADGSPFPHGRTGQLAVRGPVVMAGYDGRADLDAEVFAAGWLATGDRGFTDTAPDGRVHAFVTGPA